jgi:hypothetical protein
MKLMRHALPILMAVIAAPSIDESRHLLRELPIVRRILFQWFSSETTIIWL